MSKRFLKAESLKQSERWRWRMSSGPFGSVNVLQTHPQTDIDIFPNVG